VKRNASLLLFAFLALPLGGVFALMFLGQATQQQSCGDGGPSAAGEPPLVQYYIAAAARYQLGQNGYAYLAAINHIETRFGTNLASSSAGAIGWMQFEPATFATYGVSITDPSAPPDPYDPQDAIYSTANYLRASGAPGDWFQAIHTYNHSDAYVAEIESLAQRYSGASGLANLNADIREYWGTGQPTASAAPEFVSATTGTSATTAGTAGVVGTTTGTSGGSGDECCAGAAAPAASTSTPTSSTATGTTTTGTSHRSPRRKSTAGATIVTGTTTIATGTSGLNATTTTTAPGGAGCVGSGTTVAPVPGKVAIILPNGLARPPQGAPPQVQAMVAAGDRIHTFDYQWGGGHSDLTLSDSQTDPQPQGGSEPGQSGTPGYDCSGSTAYVLIGGGFASYFGGLGGSVPSSGNFGDFGQPGPGEWVTWYYTSGHVFIEVAGIVMDTGHQPGFAFAPTNPPTGPRWVAAGDANAQQSAMHATGQPYFQLRHPEGL
jgi:hypothetical protein